MTSPSFYNTTQHLCSLETPEVNSTIITSVIVYDPEYDVKPPEDSVSKLRLLFCYNLDDSRLVAGINKPIFWYCCHLIWWMIILFVDNGKTNCPSVGRANLEFDNFKLDVSFDRQSIRIFPK